MTTFINPPALGDFSSAGVSSGTATEDFVYAAGLALDPETGRRRADAVSIEDETRICLENVAIILSEVGLDLSDVFKTTCYIRDESFRPAFITAYREAFEPGPFPFRCSFVLGMAADCRVQVEAVAVFPESR